MKTYQKTWSADSRINVVHAARHVGPETFHELRDLIRQASNDRQHVKAHGAGHSYSDITQTDPNDGILIDMRNLDRVLKIDQSMLKSDDELRSILHLDNEHAKKHPYRKSKAFDYLVCIEAGMDILHLNQALDKHDLAAINLGSYNKQSVVAAMSTSTHGSGITLGPLHDMVRSLTLVSTDGHCYRIEPKNGITDPARFHDDDGMTLKQNDDWFYSAVVSMGTMGVIYSVILEVQDSYWLEENRLYFDRWQEAKEEIVGKDVIERTRHLEIYLNPNPVEGKHGCVVNKRRIVAATRSSGQRAQTALLATIKFLEKAENSQSYGILTPFIPPSVRIAIEALHAIFDIGNDRDADDIPESDKSVLSSLVNLTPLWIAAMNGGLKGTTLKGTYIAKSHQVLYLGANGADAYGIEACFEYTSMEKVDELLSAIFHFFEEKNKAGRAATTPLGIRFARGSKAYLSPQYRRPSVTFEIGMVAGTHKGLEMLQELQDKLQKKGARMHWGLQLATLDISPAKMRAQYPKYDRWVEVYRKLNSKGIFNNSFTDRMGISVSG